MKKRVLYVILVSTLMLSGCGKSNDQKQLNEVKSENTEKAVSNQNTEKASVSEKDNIRKIGNGSAIFSTNYKIEDYCNGDFIVSKSDGLLYGVINIQGKEIIPVQFDNISFMNDEKVVNGDSKNIYIKAKYEDQYSIYNENGEKILDGDASIINYKLGGGGTGENNCSCSKFLSQILKIVVKNFSEIVPGKQTQMRGLLSSHFFDTFDENNVTHHHRIWPLHLCCEIQFYSFSGTVLSSG